MRMAVLPEPVFHLATTKLLDRNDAGTRLLVTSANFPILKGMSLYHLTLSPRGVREPHWHPNADELGYCISGELLVSFYADGNIHEQFVVLAGEAFFIPSGAIHCIENSGQGEATLIVEFNHEAPEEFGVSGALGFLSDAVLGNTWGLKASAFQSLKRSPVSRVIELRETGCIAPKEAYYASPFRYGLQESSPLIGNKGGTAKVARKDVWPVLRSQALYSLVLTTEGMREPHWHPETAEMGYVHEGAARMSILHPNGAFTTYTVQKGDLYFIPKAYPHHIENVGGTPLNILIFFDQAMPEDIGFTGSIPYFSKEVLGAAFSVAPSFFSQLPHYPEDLFIVDRINPLDR